MIMKTVFKLALIYFFLWIGIKSIMDIRTEETMLWVVLDIALFIIFVGSPASNYWGHVLDDLFEIKKENKNNDENI